MCRESGRAVRNETEKRAQYDEGIRYEYKSCYSHMSSFTMGLCTCCTFSSESEWKPAAGSSRAWITALCKRTWQPLISHPLFPLPHFLPARSPLLHSSSWGPAARGGCWVGTPSEGFCQISRFVGYITMSTLRHKLKAELIYLALGCHLKRKAHLQIFPLPFPALAMVSRQWETCQGITHKCPFVYVKG